MNFIKCVAALGLSLVLVACGGGGGAPGLPSGTKTPISTTAASALTLAVGAAQSFSFTGGTSPYQISSSNVQVSVASLNGQSFSITGVAPGEAIITISDASQNRNEITVTVPVPPAPPGLSSNAPASLQILNGATNFYKVFGGVPPYVVNTNGVIAKAVVSGSDLAITGVVPGVQTIAISDAVGDLVAIDVTVNSGLFTDAPRVLSLASGTAATYTIFGGTPYSGSARYRVNSSAPSVASASVSGSTLSIIGLVTGQTTLLITDSVGDTIQLSVAVPVASAILSTAPSSITLIAGTPGTTYDLSGGDGTYKATSSNPALVSTSVSGSKLTIRAESGTAGGTADVIVTDTKGSQSLTIRVTSSVAKFFTTAPSSLAIAAGPAKVFALLGGSGSYSVVNTHPDIVEGSITGTTLSIVGKKSGSGSVIVSDSSGTSATVVVTVTGSGVLTATAPASVTLAVGTDSEPYDIIGGVPAYLLTSSNATVATVTKTTATQFVVRALGAGASTITITDSVGSQKSFTVTVSETTPVAMYTTAPDTLNLPIAATPVTYTIVGGSPGYTAQSSNPGIVIANASGNTLSISAVAGGSASVVVKDSLGQSVTISVSVGTNTTLFSTAPSGTVSLVVGVPASYVVSGGTVLGSGTASYSVSNTNPGVINASFAGPVLNVNGLAIGESIVRVTDAVGATLDISFTVKTVGGGAVASTYPTLVPALQTSVGVVTSSIDATTYNLLKVTLKDPSGVAIPNQVVSVSGDLTKLTFPEGSSALTDANGLATIKVTRASLLATGAGAMTVTYDYKPGMISTYSNGAAPPTAASMVTTYVGYQVTTANISLTGLNVGASTLNAYGTRQISVVANITANGVTAPATSTPIIVSFSANCGQISPSTATTDSTGKALVTFSATDATGTIPSTLGCSGKTVQISASTTGATAVSQSLSINAAPATNMSFVSAAPTRIFLAGSGGVTQSLLTFQLLNQLGEGIAGQQVELSLKTLIGTSVASYNGIPNAAFDTSGNLATSTAPVTLTTDASGKVSQAVYSGNVPTNVVVNAKLISTPGINVDSSVLAIASGRPAQSRLSLGIEKFSIEGFNVDGTESKVTMSLSDRQGNPVPDGTVVNFVTEGGVMIPPTCTTGVVAGDSRCTVLIRSQGTRPANGLVTILAYAAGEEDFTDSNGDNVYTCGEPFTDLGNAYRDDTMTSSLVNAYVSGQTTIPRALLTTNPCAGTAVVPTMGNGVTGTFDGIWGTENVRQQAVIVFATGAAVITPLSSNVGTAITAIKLTFTIADRNGNSMPTGTTINVTGALGPNNIGACSIVSSATTVIANTLLPTTVVAGFACLQSDLITVTVTSPLGIVTSDTYKVP